MHGPAFRASPTHGYANRISPDKNVMCPRPSPSSTCTPIFQLGFALSRTLTRSYRPSMKFLFVTWRVLA